MNKPAAARVVQALTKAPTILVTNPRLGEQLFEFEPREVRRILVDHYEHRPPTTTVRPVNRSRLQ